MTKKKRIMISLEPKMVDFIDAVCLSYNNKDDTKPADRLTRSQFIALCVLAFGADCAQPDETQTN